MCDAHNFTLAIIEDPIDEKSRVGASEAKAAYG